MMEAPITALLGFRILETVQKTDRAQLFRAERLKDGKSVLVKLLSNSNTSAKDTSFLRHEHEITNLLSIDGILRSDSLEEFQNGPALIYEDWGGLPLNRAIPASGMPLRKFLKLAISLSSILHEIHSHPLIHMKVRPANIIFDANTDKVFIKDFSVASLLSIGKWHINSTDWSADTLAYMSPEQTGRMNRDIDWRTDLYSLGITFYEMLTGQLPFLADDPMEWIHCHIAKTPFPPHKLKPRIPEVVSDIVLKCLSKMAGDRYQSAYGLKEDLEDCQERLNEKGRIEYFFPGFHDISERFQIPQKLYGRQREIDDLIGIFERVAGEGTSEMALVCGYAGIGKSFLISEMQKSIVEHRGYFIQGKFNQYQRHIPYDCLIQAFQELVRQLLTESDVQIVGWKDRLQDAFGPNGQVIIDVIPEVELIVGKQPPTQKLPPDESQNRFNTVFQKLVHTIAKADHPLVIYLDDLQWADSASLRLIELLITDPAVRYLLMVVAFRDNEVEKTHPLHPTLKNIESAEVRTHRFDLTPLNLMEVTQFCADTVLCSVEEAQPLAQLIYEKTHGNPFFMNQFLTSLFEDKLLWFNLKKRKWCWELEEIQKRDLTDNVVEFMSAKIKKLAPDAQNIIKLAACIGNQFNFHILSLANEQSPSESAKSLWKTIEEGLIISDFTFQISHTISELNNNRQLTESHKEQPNFKFLHDRVQQAAYSLIEEEERKKIHLKIGRLMLEHCSDDEIEENVFDILSQLNTGIELITQTDELTKLTELNLLAGQKAKDSTAYQSALEYLTIGMDIIHHTPNKNDRKNENHEVCWKEKYDLTSVLYRERAESEYLNGNFDNAEKYFEIILNHVKSPLEKADIFSTKAVLYTNLGKNNEAVALGLKGLKLLGMFVPIYPSKFAIAKELLKVVWKLQHWKIEDLIQLPNMVDKKKKAIMNIIKDLYPPSYFTNQNLFALLILKVVQLTLRFGNAKDSSPYAYSAFGFLIGSAFGRYQTGYKFGKLGIEIAEKYNNTKLIGFSNFVFGCFINNWIKPAQTSNKYLINGFLRLVESGTFVYAGYSVSSLIFNMSLNGDPLDELYEEAKKYLDFANSIKDSNSANFFIITQRQVLSLKGLTHSPIDFGDDRFIEKIFLQEMKKSSEPVPLNWYYVKKLQNLYLFGKYTEAIKVAEKSEALLNTSMGQTFIPEHYFYQSLAITALFPVAKLTDKIKYQKTLQSNQKKMDAWTENCPENFQHKSLLMAAELARINGNENRAIKLYHLAIQSAHTNSFRQNEALACELVGRFYLTKNMEKVSQTFLKDAFDGYSEWGASAKASQLKNDYLQLVSKKSIDNATLDTMTDHKLGAPDLATIIKSSQAIASEIVLNKLLKNLMQIVIENAGAGKGFLILQKDNKWTIEASGTIDPDKGIVLKSFSLETVKKDDSPLPLSVFHYVTRTSQNLVLDDATRENAFMKDPYIIKHQPKSMLCAPILHQAKIIGMLYLENNLMIGAFTPDRLEMLNLLSSQAAISIENACLYADQKEINKKLKQEISERREIEDELLSINEELEASNKELKETQSQLVQSAKLASIGELATGVAHELNQPLMYIRNSAQLAMMDVPDGIDPESLQETLEDIEKGTDHMMTIINHLRNFARPMNLELISIDIHDVLEDSLILINEQLRLRNIKIEKHLSSNLPSVLANAHQLEQVFINMLTNARDAMEGQNDARLIIQSEFHPKKIGKGDVSISFTDNGMGIGKPELEKIFDPFFSTKEAGKGTGLGLSISYGIIRDHQGRIYVESKEGKGTTFTITLPVRNEADVEDHIWAEHNME